MIYYVGATAALVGAGLAARYTLNQSHSFKQAKAVTTIQAAYRGFDVRQDLPIIKVDKFEQDLNKLKPLSNQENYTKFVILVKNIIAQIEGLCDIESCKSLKQDTFSLKVKCKKTDECLKYLNLCLDVLKEQSRTCLIFEFSGISPYILIKIDSESLTGSREKISLGDEGALDVVSQFKDACPLQYESLYKQIKLNQDLMSLRKSIYNQFKGLKTKISEIQIQSTGPSFR